MINLKNNKLFKNLLFIFSILLVFIILKIILNNLNNKEYGMENFEDEPPVMKYWIQRDGLFKCKNGEFKKNCPDGYLTQNQGAAIHHSHGDSQRLLDYIKSNDKKMDELEKLLNGNSNIENLEALFKEKYNKKIENLENLLFGEMKDGKRLGGGYSQQLMTASSLLTYLIPFRNDIIKYFELKKKMLDDASPDNIKKQEVFYKKFIENHLPLPELESSLKNEKEKKGISKTTTNKIDDILVRKDNN